MNQPVCTTRSAIRFASLAGALLLLLGQSATADELRDLQEQAERTGTAVWGHWGPNPQQYHGSTSHSNRLIPVYTFGITLDAVKGEKSVYRDADALRGLYGYLPENTLNPKAEYFDQTDVYRLQQQAIEDGKKYIFLIIFDGMDWQATRVAAHYNKPQTLYSEGRGTGLHFLDYKAPVGDFGFCVTSPTSTSASVDVNEQTVKNAATGAPGGYDPELGGSTPWSSPVDLEYLWGKNKKVPHAVADSACTAAAMTTGKKSYNGAINFDSLGRQSEPIARELQPKGWKVGVVTSVPVPHATPACAYANNVTRSDYQDISKDMVGVKSAAHPVTPLEGMDVVIGTGWGKQAAKNNSQGDNYLPGNMYVNESTIDAIDVAKGGKYVVVQRTEGQDGNSLLQSAAEKAVKNGNRLFGFFGTKDANLPYATADGKFDPVVLKPEERSNPDIPFSLSSPYTEADLAENPTLAEMTSAALKVLSAEQGKPFWLMLEPGDVDWASHGNNIDNAVGAINSGDAAFKVVVDWIEKHDAWDESAVIVTADHGHLFVPTKMEMLQPAAE